MHVVVYVLPYISIYFFCASIKARENSSDNEHFKTECEKKNSPIIMFINFYILFSGPCENEIPYLVTNSLTHHT